MVATAAHEALEQAQNAALSGKNRRSHERATAGELVKGAGSVHCMTGVVHRDAV